MNRSYPKQLALCVVIFILSACGVEPEKERIDEVTLQLVWKHQAQFAGFYVAEQNGFYRNENINVTIKPRLSPAFDVIDSVVKGGADFGVTYGIGLIKARSKKLPIMAIASIYKQYPLSFISLKEKRIEHPRDFVGRRIRYLSPGGATVLFNLLLKKYTIDRSGIFFIQVGYDFDRFFSGEVDVWAAYTINEVLLAEKKGYEINQIKPDDFGIHMLGDTLFTSDILLNTNPDLVKRFVRATLRGWQWAVKHPEAAGALPLEYDRGLERDHQVAMMKASIPYIEADTPLGEMDPLVWKEMHDSILELGIIKKPVDLKTVYTNYFVETQFPGNAEDK